MSRQGARQREELIARAGMAGSVRELFAGASDRLRRLVPFDAAVWMATDPATTLPTAPSRSENLGHVCCSDGQSFLRVWELEFLVQDVNLYRDLARADRPAAALRLTTDDRPARSPRYREFLRPNGFEDELRAVLRVDGSPWASIGLFRERGRPPFDTADAELVAGLSAPLAEAIREHSRPSRSPAPDDGLGPGLLVFAPSGELASMNDAALTWLEDLPRDDQDAATFDVALPMVVAATLIRARAIADERDRGTAKARLRSLSGRWVVCHASCLRDGTGAIGDTVLVIETAPASEVSPIVVAAYELSPREQQITHLIAHGYGTAEIAARLHLSAHTVRDYVKAIFEKVGVASRGELVAKIFTRQYAPIHMARANHDRVN